MKNSTLVDVVGSEGVFVDGDWIESKDQDPNGEVRLIQLADVGDGYFIDKSRRYLTLQKAKELKCTFLEPGDVLIARMPDPLGRACIFPGLSMPCVTVVDVCIVRPNKEIADPKWLQYLINSDTFRNSINQYVTGTTRQRISRGNLKKIAFEVPPIEQQQKVIDLLDQADALRRKRRESMELLDQYVQSVFMEMFGDPVVNPHGFSITELQTCYKGKDATRCGPFGSALKKQDYCEKGIPVWTMENIKGMTFDPTGYLHVSENKYAELIQYKTQNGDIIISRAGTVGKMAIIETSDDRSIISTNLIKLSLDEKKLLPLYFVSLMFFCSKRLARLKTGKEGTFTHMNTGVLNSIKFPLPPIDLQKKFASLFTEINSIKKTMQAQLFEFDNQFDSLMQKAF